MSHNPFLSRILLPNATFGSISVPSSFVHQIPWDVSEDVRSGFLEDSKDRWLHTSQTEALLSGEWVWDMGSKHWFPHAYPNSQ